MALNPILIKYATIKEPCTFAKVQNNKRFPGNFNLIYCGFSLYLPLLLSSSLLCDRSSYCSPSSLAIFLLTSFGIDEDEPWVQEGLHNTTIGVGMKTFTRNAAPADQKDDRTLFSLFPPPGAEGIEFECRLPSQVAFLYGFWQVKVSTWADDMEIWNEGIKFTTGPVEPLLKLWIATKLIHVLVTGQRLLDNC